MHRKISSNAKLASAVYQRAATVAIDILSFPLFPTPNQLSPSFSLAATSPVSAQCRGLLGNRRWTPFVCVCSRSFSGCQGVCVGCGKARAGLRQISLLMCAWHRAPDETHAGITEAGRRRRLTSFVINLKTVSLPWARFCL